MSFDETGAVEMQEAEVTEPQETTETDVPVQAEESEVIEQTSEAPKTKRDADAWAAEIRRENEDLARQLKEANDRLEEMEISQNAFNNGVGYFTGGEDGLIDLIAENSEMTPDEVRERLEAEEEAERGRVETERREAYIEELEGQLNKYRVAEEAHAHLDQLQKINSNIKFEDLDDTYWELVGANVSPENALFASMAKKDAFKRTPPPDIGGVKTEPSQKDFISKEEAFAMSPAERTKNWKLIRESQKKW